MVLEGGVWYWREGCGIRGRGVVLEGGCGVRGRVWY